MKKSLLITLLVTSQIYFNNFECFGQSDSIKKKIPLHEFGLIEYPSFKQVEKSIFEETDIFFSPITPEDINSDFSNIEDLLWLKEIAESNKVILLGENHYFKYIQHLRNRIYFAINMWDYYPLIILEQQYSKTPFINHYVMIKDDELAEEYAMDIYGLIHNESEFTLIKHIRRWNINYPEKPLHIGYTDIEHDYKTTINKIIIPYFKKIDSSISQVKINDESDFGELLTRLDSLIIVARETDLHGRYQFISHQYIQNVIENLRSFYYSKYYDFSFYRQKAIIRNLTDPGYLGEYFANGKVLIHGGSYHTPTHFPYPDGGNFLREGSYLTFENLNTIGKTYSIAFEGLTYSLSEMHNINLASCLHTGSNYSGIVRRLQNAYTQGLIETDEFYFAYDFNLQNDPILKHVIKESYGSNNHPLRLTSVSWENILKKSDEKSTLFYESVKAQKEKINKYDSYIFVPQSPIIKARRKTQSLKPERKITFKVITKVYPDSMVFITGNHMKLGNWNPGIVALKMVQDSVWEKTILFEEDTELEFKITRGSWSNEAIENNGQVLTNFDLSVKKDSTITIIVDNWKDSIK